MTESKSGNKSLSLGLLVVGAAMMGFALVLDVVGIRVGYRGPLLIAGALAVLAGLYFYPTIEHHRVIINFIFLFPLLFTFTVTVIIPMALGIGYSFTDWNGVKVNNYVGLANYTSMFKDPAFIWSIVLTFLFVIVNMILVNVIGFLLALLCSSKIRGTDFYRASYFLPNLIGGIVLGYIWSMIFDGILRTYGKTLVTEPVWGFWGLIVVIAWQQIGYMMIIYIAGLQAVPEDMIEAAKIDGASKWQTLWRVTIPNVMPSITICTFLTLTNGFKLFDQNLALTGGQPFIINPDGSAIKQTEMIALNIYNTFYTGSTSARGTAQAKAVLFFILVAALGLIQLSATRKKEVQQ